MPGGKCTKDYVTHKMKESIGERSGVCAGHSTIAPRSLSICPVPPDLINYEPASCNVVDSPSSRKTEF